MTQDEVKLDNPAYHSLDETHADFRVKYEGAWFYHPDFCRFGGIIPGANTIESMHAYTELVSNFYIVGAISLFNNTLKLNKVLVCDQMVLHTPIVFPINEEIISLVTIQQKQDLFDLVNLVQPGYFREKTATLGSYFGIYKNNELVAVTGERMKMNHFTEVSSVVTHPNHIGRGYAKQLVAYTANLVLVEGKIPYLHVAETNNRAIQLYTMLGFTFRRKINFLNFMLDE